MGFWANREDEQGMSFDKGGRGNRGGRGRDKRDSFGGDDFGGGGGDFGGGGDRRRRPVRRRWRLWRWRWRWLSRRWWRLGGGGGGGGGGFRGGGGGGGGFRRRRRVAACPPRSSAKAPASVKFFNGQKGFGFVVRDDGGEDVFVHISAVEQAGLTGLAEGQPLGFTLVDRGGRISATDLKIEGEPLPVTDRGPPRDRDAGAARWRWRRRGAS